MLFCQSKPIAFNWPFSLASPSSLLTFPFYPYTGVHLAEINQTRFSSSSWWPTVSLSLLFLCCLAMSLDGEMSKLYLCPASVRKADKKNLLVALFIIVPTPQQTNEPTMVSAAPRNTEMICLQQCRKDVLKYKPPKNFYYFLINLKILGIAFIDIHIFVKKKINVQ